MIPAPSPITATIVFAAIAIGVALFTGIVSNRRWAVCVFLVVAALLSLHLVRSGIGGADEISPDRYASLAQTAATDPKIRDLAQKAMADGRVTNREYADIQDARDHETVEDGRASVNAVISAQDEDGPADVAQDPQP